MASDALLTKWACFVFVFVFLFNPQLKLPTCVFVCTNVLACLALMDCGNICQALSRSCVKGKPQKDRGAPI